MRETFVRTGVGSLSNAKVLIVGCLAVPAAGVIGLALWSLGAFAWASVTLGALIEVVAIISVWGRGLLRAPADDLMLLRPDLRLLKPDHAPGEFRHPGETDARSAPMARSWALLLVGLPALATGFAIYLIAALVGA